MMLSPVFACVCAQCFSDLETPDCLFSDPDWKLS